MTGRWGEESSWRASGRRQRQLERVDPLRHHDALPERLRRLSGDDLDLLPGQSGHHGELDLDLGARASHDDDATHAVDGRDDVAHLGDDERIRRLNDLGFDVAELTIITDIDGRTVQLEPKVVDSGHHSRRLLRLTGLDVEENQARRLLNDLDAYTAAQNVQGESEEIVAHRWVDEAFDPVVRAVPKELRGKLEPAEVFHQLLDHRWYMAQNANRDIPLAEAVTSYVQDVLRHRRDEATVIDPPTTPISLPDLAAEGIDTDEDADVEDWRLNV